MEDDGDETLPDPARDQSLLLRACSVVPTRQRFSAQVKAPLRLMISGVTLISFFPPFFNVDAIFLFVVRASIKV